MSCARLIAAGLAVSLAAVGCGGNTPQRSTATAPEIRSAEHDARQYTEPNGRPIAPEPQGTEPDKGTPGVQDATGGKVDVPIRHRRFTPATMTLRVGQIVVFTDDDDVPHTVRNSRGGLPHSGLIPVGGRFEFTPLEPGRVRYHCIIHPQMRGELVVLPRPDAAAQRTRRARRKPSCDELRRTARHELGDTGSEIENHCVRDR